MRTRAAPRWSSPPTTAPCSSAGIAGRSASSAESWSSTHDRARRLETLAARRGEPLAGAAALARVGAHHRPLALHRLHVRPWAVHRAQATDVVGGAAE